jgi:hypothetical protein
MNIKKYEGKRFGRLTVIKRTDQKQGSSYLWLCKCDCGNELLVRTERLTTGNVKSCGCLRRETRKNDIKGKRFGRLVAVENTGRKKHGTSVWLCKCDCGNTTLVRLDDLTMGETKSCGCLHRETALERSRTIRDNNLVDGTNLGRIKSLSNQKETVQKNNTSGVTGVTWHSKMNKWQASIRFKGSHVHLGTFSGFDDAVKARRDAEIKYFGTYLKSKDENN